MDVSFFPLMRAKFLADPIDEKLDSATPLTDIHVEMFSVDEQFAEVA